MPRGSISLVWMTLMAAAIFAAGCATVEKGRTQRVTVESLPSGATVLVDGRVAGQTPLSLHLPRTNGCQITVRKRGFADATEFVRTVANEYDARFLRLGADYATGAMNDLVPAALHVELRPEMLPDEKGADPYFEMSTFVLEADAMRDRGEISRGDHRYMVRKIVEFYEEK